MPQTAPRDDLRPAGLVKRAQRRAQEGSAPARKAPRHAPAPSGGTLALAAGALALATVILLRGAGGGATTTPLASGSGLFVVAFAVAATAVAASVVALVAAARQPRRRRRAPEEPARPPLRGLLAPLRWWQRVFWTAFAAALATGTFLLMRRLGRPAPPVGAPSPDEGQPGPPAVPEQLPEASELGRYGVAAIGLLMVLAVVLTVGALVYAGRHTAPDQPAPPPPEPAAPHRKDTAQALQRAAQHALAAVTAAAQDPRAAIIACYRAMEDALATNPAAAPLDSDTASDVLARATGTGVLRARAAGDLVGLFNQARFSAHPMTEQHRAQAAAHLRDLLAELDGNRGG